MDPTYKARLLALGADLDRLEQEAHHLGMIDAVRLLGAAGLSLRDRLSAAGKHPDQSDGRADSQVSGHATVVVFPRRRKPPQT